MYYDNFKICACCNKDLPVSCFTKCKKKYGEDLYYSYCRECKRKKEKEYAQRNKERSIEIHKKARDKRRDNGTEAAFRKRKRSLCDNNRIRHDVSNRIRRALKTKKKSGTEKYLGGSIDFFRGYIESQFESGMTWANMGEWHLDHIIPCAYFDLSVPEQQKICFNYRNLQPLWGSDNCSKSDSIPENVEELVEFLKQEIYG